MIWRYSYDEQMKKLYSKETLFYEIKTFWHFDDYAVRSVAKIESYQHLLNTVYTSMITLPLEHPELVFLTVNSLHERRLWLSHQIQTALFFDSLARYEQSRLKRLQFKIIVRILDPCWSAIGEKL